MSDLIDRQAALDAIGEIHPLDYNAQAIAEKIKELPSAQQERLTDDDFETIRIHLNAYKETLCNQRRWKEAEEYQRIIDRFMSFASAQPGIIRCKDCRWWDKYSETQGYCMAAKHGYYSSHWEIHIRRTYGEDFFCADAEPIEQEDKR